MCERYYLHFLWVCVCAKSFQLYLALCDSMEYSLSGSSVHGILQNTGVAYHVLLQGIFLTQGSNPCLLMSIYIGRWVLYH